MGADQVVVAAVLVAALFCVFVLCMEFVLPMFTKLAFDQLCRDYLLIAEMDNGLDAETAADLRRRVAELGLEQVELSVTSPGDAKRGEWIELSVRAALRRVRIVALFHREEEWLPFVYDRRFLARRIVE